MSEKIAVLTGQELLNKVKELNNLTREQKAEACGYYNITKKGSKRVRTGSFLKALIDAEGINLDETPNKDTLVKSGRKAKNRIKVQANSNLLLGVAYTKQLNLEPGDEITVKVGRNKITLEKVA